MSLKGVFYIEEIWIHWPNIKSQKIILLVSWVYLVWSKKDQRFPPIFIKVLYLHLMVDWTVLFSSRITICPVGGGLPVIDRIRMECGASNQGNATLHNKEVWSQSAPPPAPHTFRLEVWSWKTAPGLDGSDHRDPPAQPSRLPGRESKRDSE